MHERLEGEQLGDERVQGRQERGHHFLLLGVREAGGEQAGGALAGKGNTGRLAAPPGVREGAHCRLAPLQQ